MGVVPYMSSSTAGFIFLRFSSRVTVAATIWDMKGGRIVILQDK